MEATSNRYDVAILGGGLAGLTLALQLKRQRPETSIFVAEKRPGPAPEAAFKVDESELDGDQHSVTIVQGGPGGDRSTITARWVVDAAGRSFILRNKLGLAKDVEHDINSAWWRVGNGLVDHEEWGAHDETWMARMERPGIRRYSTTHLVGEGYWVWLIPLASNSHSIGIVADPRF